MHVCLRYTDVPASAKKLVCAAALHGVICHGVLHLPRDPVMSLQAFAFSLQCVCMHL